VLSLPQLWCGLSILVREGSTNFFNVLIALVILGMIPAIVVYLLKAVPARIAGDVKNSERLRSLHTWEVGDQQIVVKTDFSETKFDWDTFSRVLETRDYFLLLHAVRRGLIEVVPKRAFDTTEKLSSFRNLLMAKISKYKTYGMPREHNLRQS
jgi:hypothetical protein